MNMTRDDIVEVTAFVTELRKLHPKDTERNTCQECFRTWPCQTIQAVDRFVK